MANAATRERREQLAFVRELQADLDRTLINMGIWLAEIQIKGANAARREWLFDPNAMDKQSESIERAYGGRIHFPRWEYYYGEDERVLYESCLIRWSLPYVRESDRRFAWFADPGEELTYFEAARDALQAFYSYLAGTEMILETVGEAKGGALNRAMRKISSATRERPASERELLSVLSKTSPS